MKIRELIPEAIMENEKYEFKAKLNKEDTLGWAKTLAAFANIKGGYLIVGVSDNGDAFGLTKKELDDTKNLVALINDRNIFPHIRYSFSEESVDPYCEKFVLLVRVFPSNGLVRYRSGDFSEKVFIKGDANSRPAYPEEIIELGKKKFGVDNSESDVDYDESKWQNYIELCKEYRDDHRAPSVKELESNSCLSPEGKAKSGFLMFKDDYSGGDTAIHCRLWKGKDKSGYVISRKFFRNGIAENLLGALSFLEQYTCVGYEKLPNGGRKELRSYPKDSLREALVNAIAHRDYAISGSQVDVDIYDDRVDITSPGTWLLPKAFEEYDAFSVPSIRRNEIIAACFDVANLMECAGSGFKTMFEPYSAHPENPQPKVLSYEGFFILRLPDLLYEDRKGDAIQKDDLNLDFELSELQSKAITLLEKSSRGLGAKEMQEQLRVNNRVWLIKAVVSPLLEKNIIVRLGKAKSKNAVYVLTPKK